MAGIVNGSVALLKRKDDGLTTIEPYVGDVLAAVELGTFRSQARHRHLGRLLGLRVIDSPGTTLALTPASL